MAVGIKRRMYVTPDSVLCYHFVPITYTKNTYNELIIKYVYKSFDEEL